MEKSRLISLLSTFSNHEMRQFSKFIRSPFFNESDEIGEFFSYLYDEYPRFSEHRLALPVVWKSLFPTQSFREIKLRQMMSRLLTLAENFLSYQQWQSHFSQAQLDLSMSLQARGLDKLFLTSFQIAQKKNETLLLRNVVYYNTQSVLAQLRHRHIEQQEQRDIEPELQNVSDALDVVFVLQKLKFFCKMHNYELISHKAYHYGFRAAILTWVQAQDFVQYPVLGAYYFALMTIVATQEDSHFFALKNILENHIDLFLQDELQDLFVLARNFCIRRANLGDRAFAKELLDLYKTEIKNQTILTQGYIAPATYKNIVTLAIALKDSEWAADFVEQSKQQLRPEHRAEVYSLNLARILFSQKNYAPILPLLQQLHYRDTLFELSAKTLLLQTYFELGEYTVLLSFLDSFSVFLQRKTSVSSLRKHYQYLIKYVKKRINIPDYDKAARQALLHEVEQLPNVAERAWLLSKIS